MLIQVFNWNINEPIGDITDHIPEQMDIMGGVSSQIATFIYWIRMTIANKILETVCDRLRQAIRVPVQLAIADNPPHAVSIKLDDCEHIIDKRSKSVIFTFFVLDKVGDNFFWKLVPRRIGDILVIENLEYSFVE